MCPIVTSPSPPFPPDVLPEPITCSLWPQSQPLPDKIPTLCRQAPRIPSPRDTARTPLHGVQRQRDWHDVRSRRGHVVVARCWRQDERCSPASCHRSSWSRTNLSYNRRVSRRGDTPPLRNPVVASTRASMPSGWTPQPTKDGGRAGEPHGPGPEPGTHAETSASSHDRAVSCRRARASMVVASAAIASASQTRVSIAVAQQISRRAQSPAHPRPRRGRRSRRYLVVGEASTR